MKQWSLTCGFSRFWTANDGKFDGQGRVGIGLTEVLDRVDHEGVACLLGGKEVNVVVEEDGEARSKVVLHVLEQISFCVLNIHPKKKEIRVIFYTHFSSARTLYFYTYISGYTLI